MFKNKIKNITNRLLSILNLKIVSLDKSSPFDFTNIDDIDPITAQYLIEDNKIIINIDLELGRTNRWFDMSKKSLDPPIFAIRQALKKDLSGDALVKNILLTLQECQSLTKFNNAAELLGLESEQSNALYSYPWWAEVKPWDSRSIDHMLEHSPFEVKKNRASNGMRIDSNDPHEIMRDDLQNSLPSHAKQYAKLTEAIKKYGFKYGGKSGYVSAEVLIADGKMCWKLGGEGNHRAAAASALGLKKIPVLVTKIIRLDELDSWPNVKLGTFSKKQATEIFYSVFDAKPPKIYNNWVEKNKSHI